MEHGGGDCLQPEDIRRCVFSSLSFEQLRSLDIAHHNLLLLQVSFHAAEMCDWTTELEEGYSLVSVTQMETYSFSPPIK